MLKGKTFNLLLFVAFGNFCFAQNVSIQNYSVNNFGQVQLEIEAQADQYYILSALHEPNKNYESITSITMGQDGNMLISEPLSAYPLTNYKITAHSIANPDDTDGDGINDITEYNEMPSLAPLNFAEEVPFVDGTTSVTDYDLFSELAVINSDIPWAPFLNNQEFAKFAIINQDSDEPEVYFINSKTHYIHADFLATIDINGDQITTGEIVYNPNVILPNGAIGSYSFNYSFGDAFLFDYTRKTYELLAANMPFLKNNLQHFIGTVGEQKYLNQFEDAYNGSRIPVVLESELFADINFLPFNQAEGYGFFKLMSLNENPGSRDIVLYESLPNSLPRVGGIITSVVQTPLSHVNLRAIQDNVPNAYIKEPLLIDSISDLLGQYIYYKVTQDRYEIREATLEEVNDWYENIRPTENQTPERDLTQTSILPLNEISFEMSNAFGAKCTNVATMRNFGFPDGTIPDGFGIPFYFYDEFMKFNGFYAQAQAMISDPTFNTDLETRIDMLKDFRKEIRAADMPQWMLDELQVMHDLFPAGTAVRCRSSTNNEDLPGFSGAGLYTSKTQHLDEGHISKSVKQVYASMWNFRAYDERDFYRVDHFIAAMGILCHPNFEEEKSNGVGISIDPIYQTENTFYLNTQVGEALITNPNPNDVPEEILLNIDPNEGYFVLRESNLVPMGELVMDESYLDQMRDFLKVIHDEFEILYNVVGAEGFGMDIEYKVTVDDQLIIKQARPWVSFWADIKSNFDLAASEILYPQSSASLGNAELVTAKIRNAGLQDMQDFEISLLVEHQLIETIPIGDKLVPQSEADYQFTIPQDFSAFGDHKIDVIVTHPSDGYDKNDTISSVVNKLHLLEGGITAQLESINCGEEIEALAQVTNYGEATFSNTEIQVIVNGVVVETINYDYNIPYQAEVDIIITITENLNPMDNEITLNLIGLNGQQDAINTNNSASFSTDLDGESDYVTLVINTDDFPQETSWAIYDDVNNELVESGSLNSSDQTVIEEVCVNYNSCFSLFVYDSVGDGICCDWGIGDFYLLNSSGDTLVTNSGNFGLQAIEPFCPSDVCIMTADVVTNNASNQSATDGSITINPINGIPPYSFSINNGQNFTTTNVFANLSAGEYMIVVMDSTDDCIYEETIIVEPEIINVVTNISENSIKLFPNPTTGDIVIEFVDNPSIQGPVKVELYNGLGMLIGLEKITLLNNDKKAVISIDEYPAGTYFVKCFNRDFERYFKVIKI